MAKPKPEQLHQVSIASESGEDLLLTAPLVDDSRSFTILRVAVIVSLALMLVAGILNCPTKDSIFRFPWHSKDVGFSQVPRNLKYVANELDTIQSLMQAWKTGHLHALPDSDHEVKTAWKLQALDRQGSLPGDECQIVFESMISSSVQMTVFGPARDYLPQLRQGSGIRGFCQMLQMLVSWQKEQNSVTFSSIYRKADRELIQFFSWLEPAENGLPRQRTNSIIYSFADDGTLESYYYLFGNSVDLASVFQDILVL
eukprot:TRINITY_DN5988_c0_g1_i1.p1 TRINITY_DN5988_c0_g1~~TRINITY_DN5988_c0_g1_i1.p1  ORF type:complete len:256 (+),score=43.30 TRINITY_DN5988_c0_g1_i1:53-820(+)